MLGLSLDPVDQYAHITVVDKDGRVEEWFLTQHEVLRIRERAADKGYLTLRVSPLPRWKVTVLRWFGIL
jgi:hypothetical protein